MPKMTVTDVTHPIYDKGACKQYVFRFEIGCSHQNMIVTERMAADDASLRQVVRTVRRLLEHKQKESERLWKRFEENRIKRLQQDFNDLVNGKA